MHLKENTCELSSVMIYRLFRRCLRQTHILDRKRIHNRLSQERGFQASLRRSLFQRPLITEIILLVILSIFLVSFMPFVHMMHNNAYVLLSYLFIVAISMLMEQIYLAIITPRSEMKYDEIWSDSLDRFLNISHIKSKYSDESEQLNEARIRVQKAIDDYDRLGEWLRYILLYCIGPIFANCLSSSEFQKALSTFSPVEIWNTNYLGAISSLYVPLAVFYYLRYGFPIIWMKQLVSQIEQRKQQKIACLLLTRKRYRASHSS